jgi:hypothetical protein
MPVVPETLAELLPVEHRSGEMISTRGLQAQYKAAHVRGMYKAEHVCGILDVAAAVAQILSQQEHVAVHARLNIAAA